MLNIKRLFPCEIFQQCKIIIFFQTQQADPLAGLYGLPTDDYKCCYWPWGHQKWWGSSFPDMGVSFLDNRFENCVFFRDLTCFQCSSSVLKFRLDTSVRSGILDGSYCVNQTRRSTATPYLSFSLMLLSFYEKLSREKRIYIVSKKKNWSVWYFRLLSPSLEGDITTLIIKHAINTYLYITLSILPLFSLSLYVS